MPFFDLSKSSDSISAASSADHERRAMTTANDRVDVDGSNWSDSSVDSSVVGVTNRIVRPAGTSAGDDLHTQPAVRRPVHEPASSQCPPGPPLHHKHSHPSFSRGMPPSGLNGSTSSSPPSSADVMPHSQAQREPYPYISYPTLQPPPAMMAMAPPAGSHVALPTGHLVGPHPPSTYTQLQAPTAALQIPSRITTTRGVEPTQPLASKHKTTNDEPPPAVAAQGLATTKPPKHVLNMSSGLSSSKSEPEQQLPPPKPRSSPPSKLPNLVEEVTQVILPTGFFQSHPNTGGGSASKDAIARFAELVSKAGVEEESGLYKTWTSTSKPPSWSRVGAVSRELPLIPPRPGSSSSSSSVSSFSEPLYHTKSLATDVFVDSRYIKEKAENGKLVPQGSRGMEELGPLDQARFRDYRIYPVDYHVTRALGLYSGEGREQKETDLEEEEEEEYGFEAVSSRGRNRKRTRRLEEEHPASPKKRRGRSRKEEHAKASSRVGGNYQAKVPLRPCENLRESDNSYVPQSDQLWDPQQAAAAIRRGEDIDGFLQQAVDLNSTTLLMEALHRSDYCVARATGEFIAIYRLAKEASSQLQLDEVFQANAMFESSNKNFHQIARKLGRSVSSVLVHYYQWKGQNTDGVYTHLKNRWNAESDWCHVCADGGQMIVCEHCHKSWHLECLVPPLKKLPRGEWFCPGCMKSPAKLNRSASISRQSKPSAQKNLAFMGNGDESES